MEGPEPCDTPIPPKMHEAVQAMCRRESVATLLRRKSRRLRDEAHSLDKLADELEYSRFGPEAERVLYEMADKYCF